MNLHDSFEPPVPTIVLAEGEFGKAGGKTAHGVVLHSELFEARAVVDTETAGKQPTDVLDQSNAPDIPIVASVADAIEAVPDAEALVIGVAPAGGELPDAWVSDIETAITAGCDVVSGLHTFLSEMDHWSELATEHGVRLFDVRKPPDDDDLRVGDGSVDTAAADVVLTLGTDCAVGKRTTTFELYRAAKRAGIDAGWVATGQTGIMVGAQAGVVIDRVPADFVAGVVEDLVLTVAAAHDVVFVEGQASLTHRVYSGVTLGLLHGCWPDTVVLADDPDRPNRTHFEQFDVQGVEDEVALTEALSDASVAALSTWGDPAVEAERHNLPAVNIYDENGPGELLATVQQALTAGADGTNSGEHR